MLVLCVTLFYLYSFLKILGVASLITIFLILTSCHNGLVRSPATCRDLERQINLRDPILTLILLADAYEQECYQTVLRYGAIVRPLFRHKTFSVVAERSLSSFLMGRDGICIGKL